MFNLTIAICSGLCDNLINSISSGLGEIPIPVVIAHERKLIWC